jgi:hypothetical protein
MSSPITDPVRAQVRALLARLAGGAAFTDGQDVFATGVVRSMNLLELIVGLEDTYGLVVTQREVFEGRLRSVDLLVELVRGHAGVAA